MKTAIIQILLLLFLLAIFVFRLSRLVKYYQESKNNSDAEERNIAYKNFIIHLILCIIFLLVIGFLVYWLALSNG